MPIGVAYNIIPIKFARMDSKGTKVENLGDTNKIDGKVLQGKYLIGRYLDRG